MIDPLQQIYDLFHQASVKLESTMNRNVSYAQIKPELGKRQAEVVDALRTLGRASNRQLSVYLNLPINSVTGRVKELRDKGAVVECGSIFDEKTNRTVTLFKLADGNQ